MQNKEVLIYTCKIQERIEALGKLITKDYQDVDDILILGILNGSFMFMSDLVKHINLKVKIDFLYANSYKGELESINIVDIYHHNLESFEQKNIILIDDILDTGETLLSVLYELSKRNPKSVKTSVLIDKHERRVKNIQPDYCGFR